MKATAARTEPKLRAALTPKLPAPLAELAESEALGEVEELELLGVEAAPVELVPLTTCARFWNAEKLRAELWTGLTAKTIPLPQ